MGRHSIYSDEIAEEICNRIANGESLRQVCLDDWLPSRKTVDRWREERPDFDAKCARARIDQADFKFDQMWEIASNATPEDVQVAKLKVSTLQWQTSKLAPKKYGDKLALSGDEDNPVRVKNDLDLSDNATEVLKAIASIKIK